MNLSYLSRTPTQNDWETLVYSVICSRRDENRFSCEKIRIRSFLCTKRMRFRTFDFVYPNSYTNLYLLIWLYDFNHVIGCEHETDSEAIDKRATRIRQLALEGTRNAKIKSSVLSTFKYS